MAAACFVMGRESRRRAALVLRVLLVLASDRGARRQSFLLAFYIIKFLITFCIIVAMNANIERLRAGNVDAVSRARLLERG